MAMYGVLLHPKFKRFIALLQPALEPSTLPVSLEVVCLGLLEKMWQVCWAIADPKIGDATDLAEACQWAGAPEDLAKALVECGRGGQGAGFVFVSNEDGLYYAHDLEANAPRGPKARIQRTREERERAEQDKEKPGSGSATPRTGSSRPGHIQTNSTVQTDKTDSREARPPSSSGAKKVLFGSYRYERGGKEYTLRVSVLDHNWSSLQFPNLTQEQMVAEYHKMVPWLLRNPSRRPKADWQKFYKNWFSGMRPGPSAGANALPTERSSYKQEGGST
jgi:hypothetical protein